MFKAENDQISFSDLFSTENNLLKIILFISGSQGDLIHNFIDLL